MSLLTTSPLFPPAVAFARMAGIVAGFILSLAGIFLAAAIGHEGGEDSCKVETRASSSIPNKTPPPTVSRTIRA